MLEVLQSLARTVLVRERAVALPLAGVSFEAFAGERWDELGFDARTRAMAGAGLDSMFGGAGIAEHALAACAYPRDTLALVHDKWVKGSGDIFFFSSGSTGAPKAARHSWDMIMQEISCANGLLGDVSGVFGLTPMQHSYGFIFSVLFPALRGLRAQALPPLPTIAREVIGPKSMLVGFPDFWRNMPHDGYAPPPGLQCVSATAPWPVDEQAALRRSGFVNILEIYGSSENGVIGWRKHQEHPFELAPHWRRGEGHDEAFIRHMPDGSDFVTPMQDQLAWEGERRFRPVKRLDNAVQVSGINVYPARIAALVAAHPGVSCCRARLMRPEEGRRIKMFVVPKAGWNEAELRASIKDFCRKQLTAPERPGSITFGPNLPKTQYGKDSDW